MYPKEVIKLKDAVKIILQSQLLGSPDKANSKEKLYKIIEQLGYIQIDTISVVERSHHHILWTRMPGYKQLMLDELLSKDKKIFEYWSHAAAFLPMKDFRFSLIRKKKFSKNHNYWGSADQKIIRRVYSRIKTDGPLQSKDFEDKRQRSTGWWDWKPSKDALDYLFHAGKLMVAKRVGFQKVYDLTERVIPLETDTRYPTEKEFYKYLILTSLRANGIMSGREIFYLRKLDRKIFENSVNELLESKELKRVSIENKTKDDYFMLDQDSQTGSIKLNAINILSPFDNLIIQRRRLKTFFNFDYQLECYIPQHKRKFGYFCLPVLAGLKFLGKIDLKSSRSTGELIVINMFYESDKKLNKVLKESLKRKLNELAKFSGCQKVTGLEKI